MSKKKRNPHKKQVHRTYSMMDVMMASPTNPIPQDKRLYQLNAMRMGLYAMENDPTPQKEHWRCVADVVNMFETLVQMKIVADEQGLLTDATNEMAKAAKRSMEQGVPIRLSGTGIQVCRAMLDDYAGVIEVLPERIMVLVHMKTEKRLKDIQLGRAKSHDIKIISL